MKKVNRFYLYVSKILIFCLIFNIIMPILPFSTPFQQKAYAYISDPGQSGLNVNDSRMQYTSSIWVYPNKAVSDGLWKVYVDGQLQGQTWAFAEITKHSGDYNTMTPSTIRSWASAFNGNPDYVYSHAMLYQIKASNNVTFSRATLRDVARYSGTSSVDWDPNKKKYM